MTRPTAEYVDATQAAPVSQLPLAHLSIELGHLYKDDYAAGPERLRQLFRQVAPWVRTASQVARETLPSRNLRLSTCFLVDDYFTPFSTPAEVIPQLMAAAAAADLEIDYLVRESACAVAGTVDLADVVQDRLVADPPPGTTGARAASSVSGWLCNGQRSPAGGEAMRELDPWRPPSENGAHRHSIFIDVELWDEPGGQRRWSCPYLASVWQLLRLGLLRHDGRPVVEPVTMGGSWAGSWAASPPVSQLSATTVPFTAYRTFSVLSRRFLPTEHAVTTILGQYSVDAAVAGQVAQRAHAERQPLPPSIVDRIGYAFLSADW